MFPFTSVNIIHILVIIDNFVLAGFLLPPESGEKVSLEVTVLLSQAVFLLVISDFLPPSADNFPIIGNGRFLADLHSWSKLPFHVSPVEQSQNLSESYSPIPVRISYIANALYFFMLLLYFFRVARVLGYWCNASGLGRFM